MATYPARTIGVTIERSPREVYAFAVVPENLPKWAAGLGTSGERSGDAWVAQMEVGQVTVRFVERNELGVLDHIVTLPDGQEVYNPMRVMPNGTGSEVSFTLFRLPGVTDAQLEADEAQVRRDLETLKGLLEGGDDVSRRTGNQESGAR
ncbi:MAG TPA: SRPBCC family protein [Chloroflexota bacterium]|nr:SRPBCC family protein [Chloroflexota bacterium]